MTRKKLEEKLTEYYQMGYEFGSIDKVSRIGSAPTTSLSEENNQTPPIVYAYARHLMLESLKELRNNTWDKDRVDDLIEVLEDSSKT